tara:strand:+ start:1500 stop:2936 length:1437 start_codon:yes stop_codon:yes gene_type:complete
MPLKNGELSGPEIRVLIRGHNKLAQIKVPPGLDRDGLIKFLKSKKYTVDHKKKRLVDDISGGSGRGRKVTLETAKKITKPKPKTDEQKAATKAKKDMKAKATKDKEDAIKAEGVKQGAALQRVVSKRVKAKKVKVIGVKGSTKQNDKFIEFEKLLKAGLIGTSINKLKPTALKKFNEIRDSIKSGEETRKIRSIKINYPMKGPVGQEEFSGPPNLQIKFPDQRAIVLPFDLPTPSNRGNKLPKDTRTAEQRKKDEESIDELKKKIDEKESKRKLEELKKLPPEELKIDISELEKKITDEEKNIKVTIQRKDKSDFGKNRLKELLEKLEETKRERDLIKTELSSRGGSPKTKQEKVDEKRANEQAENNKVFENKIVPLVVKDVTPVVLDWLKKAPKLESTLKDKDGNTIKRTKGARKPLYIKEKEKFGKIIFGILADIYDEFNFRKPNTDQARSLLDGKLSSWGKYGGVPAAITKAKEK